MVRISIAETEAVHTVVTNGGAVVKRDQFRQAVLSVAVVGALVGSGTVVEGNPSLAARATSTPTGTATAAMRVIELPGLPGHPHTSPSDLNDEGMTVGYATGELGSRAVRWSRDGKVTELPGLGGSSVAKQINSRGTATGYVSTPSGRQFAALWDASGRLTVLPSLPGYQKSEANAINDNGTVVGAAFNGEYYEPPYRPVLWDRQNRITELPLPPGYEYGAASLINKHGRVAGFVASEHSDHWRAVRWDRKRNVRVLETLGGPASWVMGMNDRGAMVGRADWAPYRWGPVRWDRDGRVTELPLAEPGRHAGFALKINDHGVAVGIRDFGPPDTAALRWDRAGRVTALRSLGGSIGSAAVAINDRGTVVGDCLMGDYTGRPVMWHPDGRLAELPLPDGYQSGGASLVNNRGVIVGQGAGTDQADHALLWRPA